MRLISLPKEVGPFHFVPPDALSLREYLDHVEFSTADLDGLRILDLDPGPSSFAIEAILLGASVVAVDPFYRYPLNRLRYRCSRLKNRMGPLRFLEDYSAGVAAGRYRSEYPVSEVFVDQRFDLILCHSVDTFNVVENEYDKNE